MQPSPAQLLTLPPVVCNMAETSLSRQDGGVGYSKHLAARRSRLTYGIRCRGSGGGPKLAIAAALASSPDGTSRSAYKAHYVMRNLTNKFDVSPLSPNTP
jgi:hypothetical protein